MWNEYVLGEIAHILCLGSHNIPQTTLDAHPYLDDPVKCRYWVTKQMS